jgi:hypothetical protein
MTRDDIIRMARENSFYRDGENTQKPLWVWTDDELVRFAALVAAAEREACAQILDSVDNYANPMTANDCAAAIRARTK